MSGVHEHRTRATRLSEREEDSRFGVSGRGAEAGITYFPGMEACLQSLKPRLQILEVEPQVIWHPGRDESAPFEIDEQALERIKALPYRKLLHGIGFPVGGSLPPDSRHVPPFRRMIEELRPAWVSEHLSFNRANGASGVHVTGFLLPPRQTAAGVAAAVKSIRAFQASLPVPLAVETGVNYLKPRRDELPDGRFVAEVVEAADCGLLLDVHNIWANELNGRQSVDEFIEQVPLERIWEVHIAGGSEHRGFWLDSHSGGIPEDLAHIATRLIPQFPNLRALIFEVYPDYLPELGSQGLLQQLEVLNLLLAQPRVSPVRSLTPAHIAHEPLGGPSPRRWEDTLAALVVGRDGEGSLSDELNSDPGVDLMRELVREFRASMIERNLKFTLRFLTLTFTEERLRAMLHDYWRSVPPQLFASIEASLFARYLERTCGELPLLREIIGFDMAATATLIDRKTRRVSFPVDPIVVLRALAEQRLPAAPPEGRFEMEITPEGALSGRDGLEPDLEIAAH